MNTKRIWSFFVSIAMIMSFTSSFVTVKATELTEDYYIESYKTTGAGNYLDVNLDEIFKTDDTYKIAFNVKPDSLSGNSVHVTVGDGNVSCGQYGLLYIYDGGVNALGGGRYDNGGYIIGFKDSIMENGIDMEMSWDTATGIITVDVWFAHNSAYPDAEHKTFTWDAGVIADEQSYGNLKIGGEDTTVTISNLKIKNINVEEEEPPVPDPTGSYYLDSYVANQGEYLKINLDEVLQTGLPYVMKWNMKPSVYAGSCANIDIVDGDIEIRNDQGQKYGLLNIYEESGTNHAQGLGDWYKIGNVTTYKDSVLEEGIDVTILWDTANGKADVTIGFPGKDYQFSWTPGKVTGKYGNLKIGAAQAAMTITDLSIELPEDYEVSDPSIESRKIKFEKYNGETVALGSEVPASTQQIVVEFPAEMSLASINPESIVLMEKETEEKVTYRCVKTVSSYKMIFDDLLKPDCEYVLSFADTIANVAGVMLGNSVSYEFSTDEGDCEVYLDGVSVDGNKEPAISDILAGEDVKTNIRVVNSAGESRSLLLITIYYKGNELQKAYYDSFEIGSDIKNEIISRDCTIEPLGDTDNMRVFLWDGIGSMISLGENIIIR